MTFDKGLMTLENIEKFLAEESGLILDYCNHISILSFTGLRYQRQAQTDVALSYQLYLYAFDEDLTDEDGFHLALALTFDLEQSEIRVRPSFGPYTAAANFQMGDGLDFIEESLNTDFFLDCEEDFF